MNFNWIKTALLAATAMVSLNSFSQDLIARQAPIDRKLKSVDSLALQKQIRAEQSLYPGLDLYPNWNNEFVQAYGNAIVPESYTFDLTGFCMPTPNTRITDVFGYRPRRRRAHYGLDIKVYVGDTIRAAFDGKVRVVKNQGRRGYGKYVVIRHDNGLETVYGHLSKQLVDTNQLVKAVNTFSCFACHIGLNKIFGIHIRIALSNIIKKFTLIFYHIIQIILCMCSHNHHSSKSVLNTFVTLFASESMSSRIFCLAEMSR